MGVAYCECRNWRLLIVVITPIQSSSSSGTTPSLSYESSFRFVLKPFSERVDSGRLVPLYVAPASSSLATASVAERDAC